MKKFNIVLVFAFFCFSLFAIQFASAYTTVQEPSLWYYGYGMGESYTSPGSYYDNGYVPIPSVQGTTYMIPGVRVNTFAGIRVTQYGGSLSHVNLLPDDAVIFYKLSDQYGLIEEKSLTYAEWKEKTVDVNRYYTSLMIYFNMKETEMQLRAELGYRRDGQEYLVESHFFVITPVPGETKQEQITNFQFYESQKDASSPGSFSQGHSYSPPETSIAGYIETDSRTTYNDMGIRIRYRSPPSCRIQVEDGWSIAYLDGAYDYDTSGKTNADAIRDELDLTDDEYDQLVVILRDNIPDSATCNVVPDDAPSTEPPSVETSPISKFIDRILDWIKDLFSHIFQSLSISGATTVEPNTIESYVIDLSTTPADDNWYDGTYQVQYGNWALIDKDGNIVQEGQWEELHNGRYQKSITITTPQDIGNYVLVGLIDQFDMTFNSDLNTWDITEDIVNKEAIDLESKYSVTEPEKPNPSPIAQFFINIWNWIKNLFS